MITINGASVSTTTAVKLLLCSPLYISCITTANAEATENGKNDYFGLGLLKFLLVTIIPGVVVLFISISAISWYCCRKKPPESVYEMNTVEILPKDEVSSKLDSGLVINKSGESPLGEDTPFNDSSSSTISAPFDKSEYNPKDSDDSDSDSSDSDSSDSDSSDSGSSDSDSSDSDSSESI